MRSIEIRSVYSVEQRFEKVCAYMDDHLQGK